MNTLTLTVVNCVHVIGSPLTKPLIHCSSSVQKYKDVCVCVSSHLCRLLTPPSPSCLHPRWQQHTETSLYLCLQPWESCPLLPLQSAPPWLARTPDSRGDPCPPPLTSPPGLPTTWSHARQPRPCHRCRLPHRATEQVEREANPRQLLMLSTAWHRGT